MKINLLTHSSIRVTDNNGRVFYFDPFNIKDESHDADIIFVTHDHFDHFSIKDINKISKPDTLYILPYSLKGKVNFNNVRYVKPFDRLEDINVEVRPAYNINKHFHPKNNEWVGYIVKIDNELIYVVGDSDALQENENVKVDILMLPIGGTYTMDVHEASEFTNKIKPKVVIPTHYGSVVGNESDAEAFKPLIDKSIEVRIIKEY